MTPGDQRAIGQTLHQKLHSKETHIFRVQNCRQRSFFVQSLANKNGLYNEEITDVNLALRYFLETASPDRSRRLNEVDGNQEVFNPNLCANPSSTSISSHATCRPHPLMHYRKSLASTDKPAPRLCWILGRGCTARWKWGNHRT